MGRPSTQLDPDELLRRHDVLCEGCGYNLRGLAADVCPECGRPFDRAAMTYASADMGLESLTQTWLAMGIMIAANVGMWLWAPSVDRSGVLGVAERLCALTFLLAALPCFHALSGSPDVEHRRTRPDRWLWDVYASLITERATLRAMTLCWRVAWAATLVHAVLLTIRWFTH